MNYPECLIYLNRLGNEVLTMKFGLDTIRTLLVSLGNPQFKYPCILVAGTNGKGSTVRFIDSICRQAGIRTGLFTSPHLVRIEERIQVSGELISESDFARKLSEVVDTIECCGLSAHPTFFEIITATAFKYFADQQIDLGILEVGMGGRLDSTNVTDPILSVITPISYDHQQYLGNTLRMITLEKAGVMRPGRPTISAPQVSEVREALETRAQEIGTVLEFIDLDPVQIENGQTGFYSFSFAGRDYELGVAGKFQVFNALVALHVIEKLTDVGFSIDFSAVRKGISDSRFPGVIQVISDKPMIVLDGGHNTAAIASLIDFLEAYTPSPRTLVFGMMGDKSIAPILDQLKNHFSEIYLTQADEIRAASVDELKGVCPSGVPIEDPEEAFRKAVSLGSTVVVAGSLHLVGAILGSLKSQD